MHQSTRALRDGLLAHARGELEPFSFKWTDSDACRIGRFGSPLGRKTFIDVIPVVDIHRAFGEKSWSPKMAMEPESSYYEFTLEASKVKRARWLYEKKWWHILIVVWPVKVRWPEGTPDEIAQGWVHNPLGWNFSREISQVGEETPALRFQFLYPVGPASMGEGFHEPGFDKKGVKWEWGGRWDGWEYKKVNRLWSSVKGELCTGAQTEVG